jgi:hypothetical protein
MATGRTVSPGIEDGVNSIGTLGVGNNLAFSSGSGFSVNVGAGANNADQLVVTGTAAITAGATISVNAVGADQGLYTILTSTGALTGTFTGSAPSGYKFLYGANQLQLQHLAEQAMAQTTGTVDVIAGGSVNVGGTLSNTAPNGSAGLAVGLSDHGGTLTVGSLSAGAGTVAAGGQTAVTGTIGNVGAAGLGKTWAVRNVDAGAISSPTSMGGTVNVYDHSAAGLTVASGNSQTVIVGATGVTATLELANGTVGETLRAGLDVTSLGAGLAGSTGVNVVASGGVGNYTATLATNVLGTHDQTFSLTAGDRQSILGASAMVEHSADVSLTVLDHAKASFNSAASETSALTLNIEGTVGNGVVDSSAFSIFNLSGGRANLKLTGIDVVADAAMPNAISLDTMVLTGLVQGSATGNYFAHLDTEEEGEFENVYTLHFADDSGLAGAGTTQDLVLTVKGVVGAGAGVPEPASLMVLGLGACGLLRRRR